MKRSFHLHVFLITILGLVLFLASARFTARFSAEALLLNYFNETLAHHTSREIDEAGHKLDVHELARTLGKTIDDLQPDELRVSLDDANFQEADIPWKSLKKQSANHAFDYSYITSNAQIWSVLRTPIDSGRHQLYVAVKRSALERSLEEVLAIRDATTKEIMPIVLAFAVICSFLISYTALAPVNRLQKSFTKIHIHRRDEHINTKSYYKEFDEFIQYFNALIDRLRNSYEQAARFSSDVSHELRTPLTIIRGHIDRLVQKTEDSSDLQINLVMIGDEVERLIAISNKLLLLAQADAGKLIGNMAVINFSDMLMEKIDDLAIYQKSIRITSDIQPQLRLGCDKDLIQQLLSNLFTNAVKYNTPQGWIKVTAKHSGQVIKLGIYNATQKSMGVGLDDRVFDRFYQHQEADTQVSSDTSGSGLGLSLCREIVKAHGGTIHLSKTNDESVGFEISIPLDFSNI
jgi:two-component system, OmpR family, heavy metal sensor histidine kinase CusS